MLPNVTPDCHEAAMVLTMCACPHDKLNLSDRQQHDVATSALSLNTWNTNVSVLRFRCQRFDLQLRHPIGSAGHEGKVWPRSWWSKSRHAKSVSIPSSWLMWLLEKVGPGMRPRFLSQKMDVKEPEKKIPSTTAKVTWRSTTVDWYRRRQRGTYLRCMGCPSQSKT